MADVITTRKMFHPFLITWQMLLSYDIVVDVKTTLVGCYKSCLAGVICQVTDRTATCNNSCLAGVICQVADGIATVGWMCMVVLEASLLPLVPKGNIASIYIW